MIRILSKLHPKISVKMLSNSTSRYPRRIPTIWVPYLDLMRMDKPIGTWLLYLPCSWSILMSTYHYSFPLLESVEMLGLFAVGSVLLRGAGCTINDLWDRNLDSKVKRTRSRPLASGALTPIKALVFLGGQLSLGLVILCQLNLFSILLGASSVLLVGAYPLMKRITYWPQLVLGLTFNWGALLGCAAMTGMVDPSSIVLYASGVAWTLVYDTIYACQDKVDDLKIGVKSTAIRFGNNLKKWLSGFAVVTVSGLGLAGWLNEQGLPYYLVSVGGTASHFLWQIKSLNPLSPADCWTKFRSNRNLGFLVTGGIILDILYKSM
jgi:4-hydroxybenzoate polyprenyltransferase